MPYGPGNTLLLDTVRDKCSTRYTILIIRAMEALAAPNRQREPGRAEDAVQVVGMSERNRAADAPWPSGSYERIARLLDTCQRGELEAEVHAHLKALMPSVQFECGIVPLADGSLDDCGRQLVAELPRAQSRSLSGPSFVSCSMLRTSLECRHPTFAASADAPTGRNTPLPRADVPAVHGIALHGILVDRGEACFYAALGSMRQWSRWEHFLLQILTPHLSEAFSRLAAAPSKAAARLTARETEVLDWICCGKSNQDIAAILGISAWTVKIHVGRVLSKLNASTRGHAAAKACSAGLVGGGSADATSEGGEPRAIAPPRSAAGRASHDGAQPFVST